MFNISLALSLAQGERIGLFILFLITIGQIAFSVLILIKLTLFKGIFNRNHTFIDEEESLVSYTGRNPVMSTIQETINTYLHRNKGGVVDFHILKDIVDRNVDNADDEIADGISTPLYLGLAGTMIGIIISLFFLDLNPTETVSTQSGTAIAAEIFDVSPLIDGVKYAMSVSVLGLILTTVLSVWVFRPAKKNVNHGKNAFLSLLQTELLPSLVKSESAAMQELSQQLGHFSRSTPEYVTSLTSSTERLKINLESEIELINKIHTLDIREMSKSNIRVFDHLSEMMDSFEQFPAYYNELNNSLGNTIALNNNLQELVSRTDNVNAIIKEIKEIIDTGQEATTFFNAHIKDFSRYGDAVNQAIADTDRRIADAFEQLNKSVEKQNESFNKAITSYDSKLSNAFELAIKRMNDAYIEGTPQFSKLNELSTINTKLDVLSQINVKMQGFIDQAKAMMAKQVITPKSDSNYPPDFFSDPIDQLAQEVNKLGWYDYLKDGLIITSCISIIGYVVYSIFFS